MPIHGPLYIVTDDVVHPVCRDEEDPECGLITPDVICSGSFSRSVLDISERAFLASSRLS